MKSKEERLHTRTSEVGRPRVHTPAENPAHLVRDVHYASIMDVDCLGHYVSGQPPQSESRKMCRHDILHHSDLYTQMKVSSIRPRSAGEWEWSLSCAWILHSMPFIQEMRPRSNPSRKRRELTHLAHMRQISDQTNSVHRKAVERNVANTYSLNHSLTNTLQSTPIKHKPLSKHDSETASESTE